MSQTVVRKHAQPKQTNTAAHALSFSIFAVTKRLEKTVLHAELEHVIVPTGGGLQLYAPTKPRDQSSQLGRKLCDGILALSPERGRINGC